MSQYPILIRIVTDNLKRETVKSKKYNLNKSRVLKQASLKLECAAVSLLHVPRSRLTYHSLS